MKEDYRIVYVEKPERSASKIIGTGIQKYIKAQVGDPKFKHICFVLYSADEEIVGGVIGDQHWDWVYIDVIWVQEELRGLGYGSQLLARLEDEALNLGITNIYLNTFSFQAPGFYRKCGYQLFGKLDNFPAGQQRYFFTKQLDKHTQNKRLPNDARKNIYQIRVRAHIDQRWSDWFDDFQIDYQDGNSIIRGPVPDQSALHGILTKLRDLGLEILLVEKMERFE